MQSGKLPRTPRPKSIFRNFPKLVLPRIESENRWVTYKVHKKILRSNMGNNKICYKIVNNQEESVGALGRDGYYSTGEASLIGIRHI